MADDAFGGQMPDWLTARAGLSPARLALAAGGEQLTFRELDRRASGVARRLARLGIRSGDRVALLLRSGVPTVELVHGAGRMGAVLVPLNVRLAPAELAWQVADVRARLLLYDEATREAAGEAVHALTPQRAYATLPLRVARSAPYPQGERGRPNTPH